MSFELQSRIPDLLPKIMQWAETLSDQIAEQGLPLDGRWQNLAQRTGVQQPGRIRLLEVIHLPRPQDPELDQLCFAAGLFGANMTGLTLGYSIAVCHDSASPRSMAHHFRHVYQFEESGSLPAFLTIYFRQIARCGHHNAPLERDARQQEQFAGR